MVRTRTMIPRIEADAMTPEMRQRNADICAFYKEGHTIPECCARFHLKRQRVQQILKGAHVWQPRRRSNRTTFLGVTLSPPTKEALKHEADERGVSMSKLASDILDATVPKPDDGGAVAETQTPKQE